MAGRFVTGLRRSPPHPRASGWLLDPLREPNMGFSALPMALYSWLSPWMLFCGEGDNCIAAEVLLWSRDEHWTTSGKIVLRFTSFEGILSACNYNSFFLILFVRVWLVSYYSGLMVGPAATILVIVKLNKSD